MPNHPDRLPGVISLLPFRAWFRQQRESRPRDAWKRPNAGRPAADLPHLFGCRASTSSSAFVLKRTHGRRWNRRYGQHPRPYLRPATEQPPRLVTLGDDAMHSYAGHTSNVTIHAPHTHGPERDADVTDLPDMIRCDFLVDVAAA